MKAVNSSRVNLTYLLSLFISLYLLSSMISISVSQIFLAAAFLIWLFLLILRRQKIRFPVFFWPLLVYAFLSLVSSFRSVNPEISLKDSRELLLFLVVPIAYMGLQEEKSLKRANSALLVSGYASILYSIFYYFAKASPGERVMGFVGHYMTQAGLLMIVLSLGFGMAFFNRDRARFLWVTMIPLGLFALTLTLTRSAWIGIVAAVSTVLILYRPISVLILPIAVGLFFILSPDIVQKRVISIFGLKSYSNQQRIEYLKAGWEIIKEYPLFGTGPDTVDLVFQNPKYRLTADAKKNVHLHNNIVQICAERGVFALTAWLMFMMTAFVSLVRMLKNRDPALFSLAAGTTAALLALALAGLFEYNFGDSEITTLFLYLTTVPFTMKRILQNKILPQYPKFE